MYELPNANTDRVNQIFIELKTSDEPNIKGILMKFYIF